MTIEQLKNTYPDIPLDIWTMIENLDAFTYNHSIRVCKMAQIVERELGMPDKHLSEAALLHDIGKYYISSRLLGKHCGLSALERLIIDTHAYLSYFTLSYFHLPKDICQIVLYHHKDTPTILKKAVKRTKDDDIRRKSLIIRTIDIFEAITTDRPYHRGLSNESAAKTFSGDNYDAETLDILINSDELQRE